jgi:hypothetical protein
MTTQFFSRTQELDELIINPPHRIIADANVGLLSVCVPVIPKESNPLNAMLLHKVSLEALRCGVEKAIQVEPLRAACSCCAGHV